MRVKLILMEPKYQLNLGYIARTAMNFGIDRLHVVNPRAKLSGKKARMYSKHAYRLLERAKVYRTLGAAARDCDVLVGTTGIRQKAKANFKRIYLAEEAVARLGRLRGGATVGLLIGRDDTGLRSEEIKRCDMLAYIETSSEYPVLNISHAAAIFLYLLRRAELKTHYKNEMGWERPDRREIERLLSLFDGMVSRKRMRNRRAALDAFRRMLRNSQPTKLELHALITAMK
jgi:tRNA/rRNA methyltransferase